VITIHRELGGNSGGGGIGPEGSGLNDKARYTAVKHGIEKVAPVQIAQKIGDGLRSAVRVKREVQIAKVSREAGGGADIGIGEHPGHG
jgi:hypothetical protein